MDAKIMIQTNGYEALGLQEMIATFNADSSKVFPGCRIEHFYYGDKVDMVDLFPDHPGSYASFHIYSDRVSLCGYRCSDEELALFESLTHRAGQ